MYHLTNTQMGLLGSAYGVLGVFSYIIGGVLADKIKAKKLLIFSMIATGLGGLLHLFVNNFYALVVIYGLWLSLIHILHDLDFEKYPEEHCIKSQDIMKERGIDEKIIHATASHGYAWMDTGRSDSENN